MKVLGADVSLDVYNNVVTDLAWDIHLGIDLDEKFVSSESWQRAFDYVDEYGVNGAIDRLSGSKQ